MRILFALAAISLIAGCRKADNADRRGDTLVAPPVSSLDTPAVTRDCGITGNPVITDDGIGELRLGLGVPDLRERCEVISDAEELGSEGMMERVVVVRIGGETVRALIDDDKVARISVATPLIMTADSLGVDTPLRRIANKRGARFFPGEDGVYGFVAEHCAFSFRFSVPLRPPRGGDWTAAAIDSAHGDATVDRVLINRCR